MYVLPQPLPEHRWHCYHGCLSFRGDDNEAARSHQSCRLSGRVATDGPRAVAMPVVGFLSGRSLASDSDLVAAFSRALNEAGYVNGQNVAIEFRWADGQLNRLPELAAELIERKVAVLFAGASDVAAGALRVAAATVPVVLATGSDPVAAGLVASFNRPGGNLTGVTVFSVALELKRLGLLRELISPTPLIALLVNPNNLTATAARRELNDATRRIGQDVVLLDASTEGEFEAVFATLT